MEDELGRLAGRLGARAGGEVAVEEAHVDADAVVQARRRLARIALFAVLPLEAAAAVALVALLHTQTHFSFMTSENG